MYFKNSNRYKKISFSQTGEDLIIKMIFNTRGIYLPSYIDIGANHPWNFNNTAIFYLDGSKGINIEPNPKLFKLIKKNRKKDKNLNIGIACKTGEIDYYQLDANTLNTTKKEDALNYENNHGFKIINTIKINVDTIQNVLNKFNNGQNPDFFSIDVEGLDYEILQSINFDNKPPTVVCIESISFSNTGHGEKNKNIIGFMLSKNYLLFADTYINYIFVYRPFWEKRL